MADRNKRKVSLNYKNYLEEADAFNSYLNDVVAHTSRYNMLMKKVKDTIFQLFSSVYIFDIYID